MKRPRVVKHKGHTFVAKEKDLARALRFDTRIAFQCEVCGEKAICRPTATNYRDWEPRALRTCGDVVAEQVMKS